MTASFSINGFVNLSEQHAGFLRSFNINVPEMMPQEQFNAAVAIAEAEVARMAADPDTMPMITRMSQETLADLKSSFGMA